MMNCQACLTLYMKELAILLLSECPKNVSFADISIEFYYILKHRLNSNNNFTGEFINNTFEHICLLI